MPTANESREPSTLNVATWSRKQVSAVRTRPATRQTPGENRTAYIHAVVSGNVVTRGSNNPDSLNEGVDLSSHIVPLAI